MKRKVRTPEELGDTSGKKKGYNCYLEVELYEYLDERAKGAGASVSKLINEAIRLYIDELKQNSGK